MGPQPLSDAVRERMRTQRRDDTDAELKLRRELYAKGLRYRVGHRVPGMARRTIDVAFPGKKVAVFVDGCYWHRCPIHHVPAKNNAQWWSDKLEVNVARDRDTDAHLKGHGWTVLRFWEHEDPVAAAAEVVKLLEDQKDGDRA